jgi:hypothetical protein
MSERLPYEEQLAQQWNDLPLPDENMAWADMKRRLEEDDDKPLLPFWLRGCAGWALLGLFIAGLGWWIVRPDRFGQPKKENEKENSVVEKGMVNSDTSFNFTDTSISRATKTQQDSIGSSKAGGNKIVNSNPTDKLVVDISQAIKKSKDFFEAATGQAKKKNQKSKSQQPKSGRPSVIANGKDSTVFTNGIVNTNKLQRDTIAAGQESNPATNKTVSVIKSIVNTDSVQQLKKDTVKQKINEATETVKKEKKDSADKKKLSLSAGIGLQQQLPVAGQTFTPYNSAGRKGSLADYIPSVYLRMEKEKKWFLQTEFRYGAPQHTKQFVFRQTIVKSDTTSQPQFTTTTSNTLKKTFYHQLPLTFNYYILPGWSVGTGIQWNKFSSAVTENESIRRNNFIQQDSSFGKIIVPLKKDSAYEFSKSYLQAIIEMQYQWKRFSFGARYTFGLDPYIRFTLPGGVLQEEKNNTLQVFLRYRLWKSGK